MSGAEAGNWRPWQGALVQPPQALEFPFLDAVDLLTAACASACSLANEANPDYLVALNSADLGSGASFPQHRDACVLGQDGVADL